jgi:4-amino-4-deoxy-L-arabinose transferase
VIFLTALLVYGIGTYAVLDPMITLWMALAMCSFWGAAQAQTRRQNHRLRAAGRGLRNGGDDQRLPGAGGAGGRGSAVGDCPKRWREVLTYGWLAVGVCIAGGAALGLAIAKREPDFWRYFFWVEHIQRLPKKMPSTKRRSGTTSVPDCRQPAVAGAAAGALKRGWSERDDVRGALYLLGWVAMPFLFFSIAKGNCRPTSCRALGRCRF